MNKDDAREAAEFEAKAKKFREERSKAWAEYIDSNEGADALVDYFIDLMEQIDERRSEDVVTVNICDTCEEPYQVNANFDRHDCGKAGAASVDRRAIVEEAFENLLDRFIGRDFYGYDDIADVMNEALAEMEANNENSKM